MVKAKTGIELVAEWLKKHDVLQYIDQITSEKPRAKIYIDDNGYRFDNWSKALEDVKAIL